MKSECPICNGALNDQGMDMPGIVQTEDRSISVYCTNCGCYKLSADYVKVIFMKENWDEIYNEPCLYRFLQEENINTKDEFNKLKKALAWYLQDKIKNQNADPTQPPIIKWSDFKGICKEYEMANK